MQNRIKAIAIYDNYDFSGPIEYIFNIILSVYGITYYIVPLNRFKSADCNFNKALVISYGKKYLNTEAGNQIHIYASDLFSKDYLKPNSMPKIPLKRYKKLPVIYYGHGNFDGFVRKSKNLIETNIDIIASSFFMLSRYEEVILNNKDKFDRFPATNSLAYKENFLDRPIVNEYIELLWSWIDGFNLGFKRKRFWGDKNFAVSLTHDVDEIKRYKFYPPLGAISRSIKQKNLKKANAIFFDYLQTKFHLKEDPYYSTFDYIINLEKKYGFRSSFYFMTSGERYSLGDNFLKGLIKRLKKDDFEIGIHPSFNAFDNPNILKSEKEELERIVGNSIIGGRQHYLKWEIPKSWKIWEKAGLEYDATLSFASQEGFRCGICYPFKPFDILGNRVLDIWEISLIVMEGSLFSYQHLAPEEGLERVESLIDMVERHNGIFVTLWHNSSFYDLESPSMFQIYKRMLDYISSKKALGATVEKVLTTWLGTEGI